ncbi:hypothetical protein DJ568_12980 [Mucilaginibacter hurinus]|uniref:Knr4/Smi1-like domain-containing protein n=1 Tax=Mucilaginibacter hurinus TaxID=2201324 RepID=A0A367GMF2_9SPHI|nr:SMI1/KNR4 family protein [Mucilaginibacter hurinus]RCH54208.1 hypothetical protein DJ568_12980 [Mucilaginibacter hurinus]
MKQYLDLIYKSLGEELTGEVYTFENIVSFIAMNKGASSIEITDCDFHFAGRLPVDYKLFLTCFNGGTLYGVDDLSGFKLLSTDEIVQHNEFHKLHFGDDWDDNVILFCQCIGDGDYVGFQVTNNIEYQLVDCFGEVLPSNWALLDMKFDDFIERLMKEKGRKYWLV